jgi:hypothetical protein
LEILSAITRGGYFDKPNLGLHTYELIFAGLLIVLLCLKERQVLHFNTGKNLAFIAFFALLIAGTWFFGIFNQKQFIYFQF